ncbi:MAG TPA: phosphatase PAP2 family protein [Gemmatimonadaceae bacterium]|jgi:membrane-associated phospholipid phosphatase|nr:phosphatase PAP2 family protein [Gemmatimonadaceae bacterium]
MTTRTAPACVLLLLASLFAPLAAQEPEPPELDSDEPIFVPNDLFFVAGVGASTILISPFDSALANYLQGDLQTRRSLRRLSWAVENITQPGAWIIGGGLFLAGKALDNDRLTTLGVRGTEAIVIGLGVTTLIKFGAGRARPFVDRNPRDFKLLRGVRQEEYRSFPSGHTVIAFAAAVVVTEETRDWFTDAQWYIGPVMYVGATLVGISRMYDNKHWASDVLMGGAIGAFTGMKVMKFHRTRPNNSLDRWLIGGSLVAKPEGGYTFRPMIFPLLGGN